MSQGIPYFMYHELDRAGRPLCDRRPGYLRYVVSERQFAEQMDLVVAAGSRGIPVGVALTGLVQTADRVVITFDDGCETDLLVAAPILIDRGFGATFYVTTKWIGRRGFLSKQQLRDLAGAGLEIGCHGASHRFLTTLSASDLAAETTEARSELEEILGRAVKHFSCPGGRYNVRVTGAVREAGFESMATSRIGINVASRDRHALARIPIMRDTSAAEFSRFCHGNGLVLRRLGFAFLDSAKGVLGNSSYERLRALVLQRD